MISFGGSEQAVKAIGAGEWFAGLPTVPFSIGEAGATMGIMKAQGKDATETVVDANSLTGIEGDFLTPENVSGFTAQWVS